MVDEPEDFGSDIVDCYPDVLDELWVEAGHVLVDQVTTVWLALPWRNGSGYTPSYCSSADHSMPVGPPPTTAKCRI
jgi:hypothetical protein